MFDYCEVRVCVVFKKSFRDNRRKMVNDKPLDLSVSRGEKVADQQQVRQGSSQRRSNRVSTPSEKMVSYQNSLTQRRGGETSSSGKRKQSALDEQRKF